MAYNAHRLAALGSTFLLVGVGFNTSPSELRKML